LKIINLNLDQVFRNKRQTYNKDHQLQKVHQVFRDLIRWRVLRKDLQAEIEMEWQQILLGLRDHLLMQVTRIMQVRQGLKEVRLQGTQEETILPKHQL